MAGREQDDDCDCSKLDQPFLYNRCIKRFPDQCVQLKSEDQEMEEILGGQCGNKSDKKKETSWQEQEVEMWCCYKSVMNMSLILGCN